MDEPASGGKLTVRMVLTVVIVVVLACIVSMVANLAQAPDRAGAGQDSYGTTAIGYRAIYETFQTLKLPVSRGLVPPLAPSKKNATLIFWGPDPELVSVEPGYLEPIEHDIRNGATVVVAHSHGMKMPRPSLLKKAPVPNDTLTILDLLGLAGVKCVPVGKSVNNDDTSIESFSINATGTLKAAAKSVARISVPISGLIELDLTTGPKPSGEIHAIDSEKADHVIAALYPVDKGEILVVSDENIFSNKVFAQNDNAVLAAQMLYRSNKALIFDEFYHGLTIRGNPAWLLTRHPYGLLAALLFFCTAIWSWREGVRLGPALPDSAARRRHIGEYVNAMAGLFQRGDCSQFVLKEVKDGVIWMLCRRMKLDPRNEKTEAIAGVLARTDPAAAERLKTAAAHVDGLLREDTRVSGIQAIKAARQISKCL